MRGIFIILAIVTGLGLALPQPFAGVLLWSWFTLQSPHQEAFGFVRSAPLNLIIAASTIFLWLLSNERKAPPTGAIFWLYLVFLVWMTINSFFAFDPAWSWPYWDRIWKIFFLGFLVAAMATSRLRIYSLIWIAVISLFYFGTKGGLFTIFTGGNYRVNGPTGTIIGDNNQLALALLMVLPLANYLRTQVKNRYVRHLLTASIALTAIAIIGSYSRGAIIGLGALGLFMILRTRNRFLYIGISLVLLLFVLQFMPDRFFERMNTIGAAQADASVEGRFYAWQVAFLYAKDHFPFGAGFYGPQLGAIFHHYFPNQMLHAAHSIYFQVLGENGFIGLGIYLAILVVALLNCSQILRLSRENAELRWAYDLAIALQASIFVFCVAGAALSMAYYDLFIIEVAILLPLREIVQSKQPQEKRYRSHADTITTGGQFVAKGDAKAEARESPQAR